MFLRFGVGAAAGCLLPVTGRAAEGKKPNFLIITVDDMSCDSIGVFGAKVPDTSPNVDRLASEGVRFVHAHVQVGNCMPCRNVMQSGLYPHTNGVEGFVQVKEPKHRMLCDMLKDQGYFTGIVDKVGHSSPYHPYPGWDVVADRATTEKGATKSARRFYEFTSSSIKQSRAAGKPFYLLVNITDPHKPFYGSESAKRAGHDSFPPSRTYKLDEIPIPGFLPDHPDVRAELKQYYDSVRRADDLVGATLKALKESGTEDNTLVMFMSDHGMPFPFAKTNVYHRSSHTPWIVRWPGVVKPGTVDGTHMISTVDFVPTLLDAAGAPHPSGLQGRSYCPVLRGEKQNGRDYVIKEYNENAAGGRHPMRSVQTRRFCYIFNPWSNGTRKFKTATMGTTTYKVMQKLAETDEEAAERLRLFDHRVVEEFFDCEKDPDALHNLIGDPTLKQEADRLIGILEEWMVETKDPLLEAFRRRDEPEFLDREIGEQQRQSDERRKAKRKGSGRQKGKAELLSILAPRSVKRGATADLKVNHKLAPNHGKQLLHVTIKDGAGKRIDRKVVPVSGQGMTTVTFDVPVEGDYSRVSFAAFVGKDFPSCLQHVTSKPVPVE